MFKYFLNFSQIIMFFIFSEILMIEKLVKINLLKLILINLKMI